eukprot:6195445-Pleurochrysis_carterae.AAC.2
MSDSSAADTRALLLEAISTACKPRYERVQRSPPSSLHTTLACCPGPSECGMPQRRAHLILRDYCRKRMRRLHSPKYYSEACW